MPNRKSKVDQANNNQNTILERQLKPDRASPTVVVPRHPGCKTGTDMFLRVRGILSAEVRRRFSWWKDWKWKNGVAA